MKVLTSEQSDRLAVAAIRDRHVASGIDKAGLTDVPFERMTIKQARSIATGNTISDGLIWAALRGGKAWYFS